MSSTKDEINYRRIGEHFRQQRKAAGLTQRAVAEAINIEPSTYSNYERGVEALPFFHMVDLCAFFKISMGSVLDDCCVRLLPEWQSADRSKSESAHILDSLRRECCAMPTDKLRMMLNFAMMLNGTTKSDITNHESLST